MAFCSLICSGLRLSIGPFPAASAPSREDAMQAEPREPTSPRPCRRAARARMSHGNSSSCLFPPPLTSPSTPSRLSAFVVGFPAETNLLLSLPHPISSGGISVHGFLILSDLVGSQNRKFVLQMADVLKGKSGLILRESTGKTMTKEEAETDCENVTSGPN